MGGDEADRFCEELDELNRIKLQTDEDGRDWYKKEVRRALLVGIKGLFSRRRRTAPAAGRGRKAGDPGSVDSSEPGLGAVAAGIPRDLRFGLRTLGRRPFFAALVVGTLGLGIGASTTVYSLVDGILLKDLAYERPGELVAIWGAFPAWRDDPLLQEAWDKIGLNRGDYLSLRDQAESLTGVAGHRSSTLTLTGAGDPTRLETAEATSSLFHLLGIRPFLGRTFLPGEEGPGAPQVTVLGHDLWRSRFGSDSTVVGTSVTLNGTPFEVIGVLPPGIRVHSKLYNLFNSAIDAGERGLWVPVDWNRGPNNGSRDLETFGRIRSGVSTEEALTEVSNILKANGGHENTTFRLTAPREEVVAGYRSPLFLLLGASGLLLLIACGNAATLLLGEAIDRSGEVSTRVALGASRGRIAQQLFTESLILGLAGSLVGIILAPVGVRGFLALGPSLPRLQNVEINLGVLLAAALTGVVCALLFGFAPSILQHRRSLHAVLQREGRGRLGGGGRAQAALVAGELALTMVLLVTAGLLSRSLEELGRVDPGFRAAGVATIRAQIPSGHFGSEDAASREGIQLFRRQALERIRAQPGVLHAGAIDALPFPGRVSGSTFVIGGTQSDGGETVTTRDHVVTPGYFEAMGIPILAGRAFAEADSDGDGGGVILINEAMARLYWPGESPLGDIIGSGPNPYRIVGVVGDVRERHMAEEPLPMVYRPASTSRGSFSIVARTSGPPEATVSQLREAIHSADPGIPLTQGATMASLVAESSGAERFRAFLVTGFGLLATLLALVGVFGVTARSVAHRSREMGIRMALGAKSGSLVRMAALGTLRAGFVGIALGLFGALGVTRLITAFFFGIRPWDAGIYGAAAILLGALCAGAAALAAQRVAGVEPMRVLKEE